MLTINHKHEFLLSGDDSQIAVVFNNLSGANHPNKQSFSDYLGQISFMTRLNICVGDEIEILVDGLSLAKGLVGDKTKFKSSEWKTPVALNS